MDINQLLAEMQQAIAASEQQKADARRNALMQASFAMMGARKGREGEALARAGMLGLGSYNANLERSQETNTDAYKLAMLQAQAQQKQAEAQRAQEQGRYVGGAMENPAEAFAATGPVPKMPPALEQYREAARRAAAVNDAVKAKTYSEIADKLEEEFNATPHVGMVNGKPVNYLAGKRGTTKMLDVAPKPEIGIIDTRERQIAYDKLLTPAGTEWQTGMTPAEKIQRDIGYGNLNVARERLTLDKSKKDDGKWQYDAKRGLRVNTQTGEAEQVSMGGKPIGGEGSDKETQNAQLAIARADLVLEKVNEARNFTQSITPTTGLSGHYVGKVPGTPAYDLRRTADTIKANLGFQELQAMRAASPTGGALGQVAVQELAMLQAAVTNLDASQSEATLQKNLSQVEKHVSNWREIMRKAAGQPAGATGGWSIERE